MSAMDHLASDSGTICLLGASHSEDAMEVCNYLQNAVAITYIFALQLSAFGVCSFLHLYFTINMPVIILTPGDLVHPAPIGDFHSTGFGFLYDTCPICQLHLLRFFIHKRSPYNNKSPRKHYCPQRHSI